MGWIEEARKRGNATQAEIKKLSERGGNLRISQVGAQGDTEEGIVEAVITGKKFKLEIIEGVSKQVTPMVTLVRKDGELFVHPGDYDGARKYGLLKAGILYHSDMGKIKRGLREARDNLRKKV